MPNLPYTIILSSNAIVVLNSSAGKDGVQPLVMPGNVRAIQVVSLADEIDESGTGIHLTELAENTGSDSEVLISVLAAAEMLGLVKSANGNLFLTEDGLKLKQVEMAKMSTAVDLASKSGSTTTGEVAKELRVRGIEWHYKPEQNELWSGTC